MKRRLFILLTVSCTLVPSFVYAQGTLDPERISVISQRCAAIQTILDQSQRRDLVARTNRGRSYEGQLRQIEALTVRMHANNLSTQTLDSPANDFRKTVESFRAAYVLYDDRMTLLRQTDCRNKPEDFATLLEEVRVLRQQVGAEVTKGEDALTAFRRELEDLRKTLPDARQGMQ